MVEPCLVLQTPRWVRMDTRAEEEAGGQLGDRHWVRGEGDRLAVGRVWTVGERNGPDPSTWGEDGVAEEGSGCVGALLGHTV